VKSQRTFEQRLTLGGPLSISLILLCISQYRCQYAISRMQSICHSLAIDRDTHHREREKKSGETTCTCPVVGRNLSSTSGQGQLITQCAALLKKLDRCPDMNLLQNTPTYNTCIYVCTVPKFKILPLLFWKLWASFLRKYMFCNFSSYPTSSWGDEEF
jgi:hypothetical protein